MKRISFILLVFVFLGLYLFTYNSNSSFLDKEIKQTLFTSVSKPSWKIEMQNTKDSFELHSLTATQEENKGVFLLDEPIFRSYWENKFKSTASSVYAILDLAEEKLLMTNRGEIDIKLSVINVFDESAPRLYDAPDFSFDTRVHDPRGRIIGISFEYRN